MTKEQFDSQRWHKGMRVQVFGYKKPRTYNVTGVDFSKGRIRTEDPTTGARGYVAYMACIVIGEVW